MIGEGFRRLPRPEGDGHPTREVRGNVTRSIERLRPDSIAVELVPPHELMPFILPPSAEGVVQAIAAFAISGETRTAVCEFEDRRNDTVTRITLENPTGDPFNMRITLSSPDREEGEKVPPGIGIKVVDKEGATQKELDKK
ncbi:MAG TPA: hypothetical protein VM077_03540 [Candidatus Limnocylindrales bacterium]|nr:hypothetical protein [Candidatus Limnocylindrales bacterium]